MCVNEKEGKRHLSCSHCGSSSASSRKTHTPHQTRLCTFASFRLYAKPVRPRSDILARPGYEVQQRLEELSAQTCKINYIGACRTGTFKKLAWQYMAGWLRMSGAGSIHTLVAKDLLLPECWRGVPCDGCQIGVCVVKQADWSGCCSELPSWC